jgi:hypothetical protein
MARIHEAILRPAPSSADTNHAVVPSGAERTGFEAEKDLPIPFGMNSLLKVIPNPGAR